MEKVQISYPGILDGTEYSVTPGLKYLRIPDPNYPSVARWEEEPAIVPSETMKVLEFTRVPYTNIFRLCK